MYTLDLDEYQEKARETAIYPDEASIIYPLFGLMGEVGELANKYKKTIRDGREIPINDVEAELGDILWYLSAVATDFGLTLNEIALRNITKLQDRQERGVLGGSGDNR